MIIAINTRFLLPHKLEGIGWFTYETIKRIVERYPEHTFHFIFDRPYHPSFIFGPNVVPHVIPPPARHPVLWYVWFEFSVPWLLRKIKPDVFVSPDGFASLGTGVPTLMVLHDLAFRHNPQYVPSLVFKYYNYFTPKFLQHVKHIATVSHFSKNDIMHAYSIKSDKIDVLCNGAHQDFKPLPDIEQEAIRNEYSSSTPYFIYVGAIHPRKNIPALLNAFELYKTAKNSPHKLMLVGRKAWDSDEMETVLSGMTHKNDVLFISYADRPLLAKLVASARAMVYISQFEGFGIPIVEAFECGTPVITSNLSSMAEVGGSAALTVDPMDVKAVADALHKIDSDNVLRMNLVQKGYARKQLYTWDIAAEGLWQAILKTSGT